MTTSTDMRLCVRAFEDLSLRVTDEGGDGLTVEALCVPYGREIDAYDVRPDGIFTFREVFDPGCNERAVKAPNRTALTYLHDESMSARLGYGLAFREEPDGLYGRFRLDASTAAKARDILTSTHTALSVGFLSINPRAGTEKPGALVRRVAVALRHVAAVPAGQYAEARVLAVRERELEAQLRAEDEAVAREAAEAAARVAAEHDEWMTRIETILESQRAMTARFR